MNDEREITDEEWVAMASIPKDHTPLIVSVDAFDRVIEEVNDANATIFDYVKDQFGDGDVAHRLYDVISDHVCEIVDAFDTEGKEEEDTETLSLFSEDDLREEVPA